MMNNLPKLSNLLGSQLNFPETSQGEIFAKKGAVGKTLISLQFKGWHIV